MTCRVATIFAVRSNDNLLSFEHWRCVLFGQVSRQMGFSTDERNQRQSTFFFRGKMYSCQVWSVTNRSEMNKNVTRMRTKFEKKTKRRKEEKISVDLMILGCNPVSRALSYFSWVWQKIGHLLIREMFFDQFGLFTSRLWLAPSPDQWE